MSRISRDEMERIRRMIADIRERVEKLQAGSGSRGAQGAAAAWSLDQLQTAQIVNVPTRIVEQAL